MENGTTLTHIPKRANKKSTVTLWKKIKLLKIKNGQKDITIADPNKKSFGGRVIIKMKDGQKLTDEISVADAHPAGNRPFERSNYIEKFQTLTKGIILPKESERFLKYCTKFKKAQIGRAN